MRIAISLVLLQFCGCSKSCPKQTNIIQVVMCGQANALAEADYELSGQAIVARSNWKGCSGY